jgi:hypothetical protein
MNLNLEDDIPFIDQDDQEEVIYQREVVKDLDSIQNEINSPRKGEEEEENKKSREPSLTANISNGSVDFSISEISTAITQNETRKVKLPKLKFFITTIWSLILMVFYYVDIATDINLLIDYATNEMWGYFILTLIFILLPFLVIGIEFGSDWMKNENFFVAFLTLVAPFLIISS